MEKKNKLYKLFPQEFYIRSFLYKLNVWVFPFFVGEEEEGVDRAST